jgi:glycosyltransferase involved in cell wall biosynthesis
MIGARPRVLHVFGELDRGGAERRTADLVRRLAGEFEFEFCLLLNRGAALEGELESEGYRVHHVPLGLGFDYRFRGLLASRKYTIVHSHLYDADGYALRLSHRAGVATRIAHFRGAAVEEPASLLRRARRSILRRWIDSHATHILASGESVMAAVWGDFWRRDPRCTVVYSGIAPERYASSPGERAAVRAALGIDRDSPVVIQVGRLDPVKNQFAAIDIHSGILQLQPRTRLVLVGDGEADYEQALRQRIAALGLQDSVVLTGARTDVARLLSAANLMLLPSLREALPGVVLQASAAGLPVVASALPGVGEIARHLPNVIACSLQAGAGHWAQLSAGLLRGGPSGAIAARFRASPFVLDNAVASMRRIYARAPLATPTERVVLTTS